MDDSLKERLYKELKKILGPTYIASKNSLNISGKTVEIYVPNSFMYDHLQNHVFKNKGEEIINSIKNITGEEYSIKPVINNSLFNKESELEEATPYPLNNGFNNRKYELNNNEKYELNIEIPYIKKEKSSFIEYNGNSQAFNVIKEVLDSTKNGNSFHPKCFIGINGVGKTAILSMIAKQCIEQKIPVGYTNVNSLAYHFRQTQGATPNLKNIENAKVVLIDSIEELMNGDIPREGCQRIVYTVMDKSNEKGSSLVCSFAGKNLDYDIFHKQISTTNRHLGNRIAGLEKILIEPPSEDRQEFIKKFLSINAQIKDKDKLDNLSRYFDNIFHKDISVREIEGNIYSSIRRAINKKSELTPQIAKEILRPQQINIFTTILDPQLILDTIGNLDPEISIKDLKGESGKEELNEDIEQLTKFTAYSLNKLAYLTPKEIGCILGGGVKKIRGYIKNVEEDFSPNEKKVMLENLTKRINTIM